MLTESVLATLMTVSIGSEKTCRRLLRVGLDQIIDAAEDTGEVPGNDGVKHAFNLCSFEVSSMKPKKLQPEIISNVSTVSARPTAPREPVSVERLLGRDKIDEIGVKEVLRESQEATARKIERDSRETCSEIAKSLLQVLGPFNYVSLQNPLAKIRWDSQQHTYANMLRLHSRYHIQYAAALRRTIRTRKLNFKRFSRT